MRRFILQAIWFVMPIFVVTMIAVYAIDGYSDAFYLRFTSPRQSSLIIGTSRAAQGIQPQVVNAILKRDDVYNYAFTRNISPFGPTYLKSIQEKINPDSKNGIFILVVDAWSISSDGKNPNDIKQFEELNSFLANVKDVNQDPNFYYLLHYYKPWPWRLLSKDKTTLLHDDGWLEVSIDMNAVSANDIARKVEAYKNTILPVYHYSAARYGYLIKTITYLKQFGTVYLVRLPVHRDMMRLDNQLVPELDVLLKDVGHSYNVPFLDLTTKNEQYQYTDGNHLHKESGKKVSSEIANWILNH